MSYFVFTQEKLDYCLDRYIERRAAETDHTGGAETCQAMRQEIESFLRSGEAEDLRFEAPQYIPVT